MSFILNSRLKADHIEIKNLSLSKVLLKPDTENPWIVLVPQVVNIKELHQLSMEQQQLLLVEINKVSKLLDSKFRPDKLNIGILGNIVEQLHVHIICRFNGDRAWPGPIWGTNGDCDPEKIALYRDYFEQNT